ncbi:unnamed protein product, partial [Urochloa humidicola]
APPSLPLHPGRVDALLPHRPLAASASSPAAAELDAGREPDADADAEEEAVQGGVVAPEHNDGKCVGSPPPLSSET